MILKTMKMFTRSMISFIVLMTIISTISTTEANNNFYPSPTPYDKGHTPSHKNSLMNNFQAQQRKPSMIKNRISNIMEPFIDWQRNNHQSSLNNENNNVNNLNNQIPTWNCCLWLPLSNTVMHFGNRDCPCFLEFTDLPVLQQGEMKN